MRVSNTNANMTSAAASVAAARAELSSSRRSRRSQQSARRIVRSFYEARAGAGILKGMVRVRVHVTLKPSLLDSAGRTVGAALQKLGFDEAHGVRIGKVIDLELESFDETRVKDMCERLLANPVIEDYRFEVAS